MPPPVLMQPHLLSAKLSIFRRPLSPRGRTLQVNLEIVVTVQFRSRRPVLDSEPSLGPCQLHLPWRFP